MRNAFVLAAVFIHTLSYAGDATIPGEVSTPFPTITNLAVQWQIDGDDDLDAVCTVRFRARGADQWQPGMPLRRVPAGASVKTSPILHWTNRLSGSVFNLQPDTEYDLELSLHDPDGGSAERVARVRTRPVPAAAKDARVVNASPGELNTVKPGDVVLLADGNYGDVYLNKDGEPGKPIVYRSNSGNAIFSEVGMTNRKWVYLEGVTVNGPVRLNGSSDCAVMRCRINAQWGIKAYKPGMMNGYIADNIITGIRKWDPSIMGADGDNEGDGIEITGSGNVICHNRVSGFRDCLSHKEDEGAVEQMCNDFMNNDIRVGLDDGIEADFASSNCRVMSNRITNCFVGISSQPGLGGPNYFIRNAMYNLSYSGFKLHRASQGDVILHNTVVKAGDGFGNYTSDPFDHALVCNNLFVGGKSSQDSFGGYSAGTGRAVDVQNFGAHCQFDYNGYGTYGQPLFGKFRQWTFTQLPGVEYEPHGIQLGENPMLTFDRVAFPDQPNTLYPPVDLRPESTSLVVDRALMISNVNNEYLGQGPDIGAYESDQPLPIYGPRP